ASEALCEPPGTSLAAQRRMAKWWSLEVLSAWFLMVGVPVLLTAACGGALVVQQHEIRAQAYAAKDACGPAPQSTATGDAYRVCMDYRTITRPEGLTAPVRQPG
ncbi:MAG TPA: hypothetical protein VEI82_10455, partial [Myxococcota bacterium]|nr:hypothetical protein [Myxococcota bacterium]